MQVGKPRLAMIDTGAEGTFIDSAAAAEIGAKSTHKARVHGMNVTTQAQGTDIQILFPASNLTFRTKAVFADFRGQGNCFDLIIGRTFLQHCRLSMNGPRGLFRLEWLGPAKKADPATQ